MRRAGPRPIKRSSSSSQPPEHPGTPSCEQIPQSLSLTNVLVLVLFAQPRAITALFKRCKRPSFQLSTSWEALVKFWFPKGSRTPKQRRDPASSDKEVHDHGPLQPCSHLAHLISRGLMGVAGCFLATEEARSSSDDNNGAIDLFGLKLHWVVVFSTESCKGTSLADPGLTRESLAPEFAA